jgi:hypothetical protein
VRPSGFISRQIQTEDARTADKLRGLFTDFDSGKPAQIITGDFCELIKTYRGPRADVVHCDFPYGAGAHEFGQGSGPVHGRYEDTREVAERLERAIFGNLDRILAEQGALIFWFWPPLYTEKRAMLEQYFNRVDPFTLTWCKTNGGMIRDPRYDPHQSKEEAFLCSRGGRILQKASPNFFVGPVSEGLHQNEKPVAMLKHFLGMVVREGDTVFDPTCGSGSSLRAAWALKAHRVIGVEIDPDFASRARLALDEAMKLR